MARTFNGTSDIIQIGDIAAFNFERTDPFTIIARVKVASLAAAQMVVAKQQDTGVFRGWSLNIIVTTGTVRLEIVNDGGNNRCIVDSTNAVVIGTWATIAVTYNGSSQASGVSHYINGIIDTPVTAHDTLSATIQNTVALKFGARGATSGVFFNGDMAEVAIFSRALTAQEIADISNNVIPPTEVANNVGYWPICGTDSPEPDLNANNNDGTLTGTTCATHPITEANCSPCAGALGQQRLSRLNLVMDTKRPHLVWVQDILALFRSALIYSNGVYKVITERQDLPMRQVFHSGNMVPGKTEVRIGGDPTKPNQITAEFLDQDLKYEREPLYVQNSASIVTANEPIINVDLSFIGLTRKAEVLRAADLELQRRRSIKREITWQTGLEGIAVEPGDVAGVGVVTTNWEMGYGGRAIDGSSLHAVFDREVRVSSGYTYELLVWHTAADTPETRTVATTVPAGQTTYTTITVSPTSGFNSRVAPGDRLAMGITSEDIVRVRVTKITRESQMGIYTLTGEEFLPLTFNRDCPGSITTAVSNPPPSQPSTASITASGCTVCANVITVPGCIGGLLTAPGTLGSVTLNSSHNPNVAALVGDTLNFVNGPSSGKTATVSAWGGSGSNVATVSNAFSASSVPASGDTYYVAYRTPTFGGIEVEVDSGGGFVLRGVINATSGCVDVSQTADALGVRLTPFSDRGQRNTLGRWTASVATAGCRDTDIPLTDAATITGSALASYYSQVIEPDILGDYGEMRVKILGRITEVCSPANERTYLSLGLRYGAQTLIDSLVVTLNDVANGDTIGTEKGTKINVELTADGTTSRQIAMLRYRGQSDTGHVDVSKYGTGTVDSTLANTLQVTAQFSHQDSGLAVHSHGCYFLNFGHAKVKFVEDE